MTRTLLQCIVTLGMAAFVGRADVRYQIQCEIPKLGDVGPGDAVLEKALMGCESEVLAKGKYMLVKRSPGFTRVDAESQETILVNHEKKTWKLIESAVQDAVALRKLQELKTAGMEMKMSAEPIAATRKIAGYEASGVVARFDIKVPMAGVATTDAKDVELRMKMELEMWFSDQVPGYSELKPTESVLRSEMQLQSILGSLPDGGKYIQGFLQAKGQFLEMNLTSQMSGMDALLPPGMKAQPMPGMKMSVRAVNFKVGPIADGEFTIPAGYTEEK